MYKIILLSSFLYCLYRLLTESEIYSNFINTKVPYFLVKPLYSCALCFSVWYGFISIFIINNFITFEFYNLLISAIIVEFIDVIHKTFKNINNLIKKQFKN